MARERPEALGFRGRQIVRREFNPDEFPDRPQRHHHRQEPARPGPSPGTGQVRESTLIDRRKHLERPATMQAFSFFIASALLSSCGKENINNLLDTSTR